MFEGDIHTHVIGLPGASLGLSHHSGVLQTCQANFDKFKDDPGRDISSFQYRFS